MAECFACGKSLGMMDSGDSIIANRHVLCSKCYRKIAVPANILKHVYGKEKDSQFPDIEAFSEKCNVASEAVKSASYGQSVEAALLEDIETIRDSIVNKNEKILKERLEKETKAQATAKMLITSGFSFDGYTITRYSGYISGDDAVQIDRGVHGWFSNATNVGEALTRALVKIRRVALQELKEAAYDLGCNAVIGVDYDYITLEPETANSSGGTTYLPYVIAVTANGNAVVIEKNEELLARAEEDEDEIELAPIQDTSFLLKDALTHASKFSTVEGMRKNLEHAMLSFDYETQQSFKDILSVSNADLANRVRSEIEKLN